MTEAANDVVTGDTAEGRTELEPTLDVEVQVWKSMIHEITEEQSCHCFCTERLLCAAEVVQHLYIFISTCIYPSLSPLCTRSVNAAVYGYLWAFRCSSFNRSLLNFHLIFSTYLFFF